MIGIQARFELFPTLYASCDTSDYLLAFFHPKSQKMQNLLKIQTTWHGALNWSYKAIEKN